MHTRWKKNFAGMLAAGHPECKYIATVDMSYGLQAMNCVRQSALYWRRYVYPSIPRPLP